MYKFPPIVANDVKHVSPIIHSFGIIYFALSIVLPKFCQYFIVGISLIETFIIVSISDMPTVKYWQNLGRIMEKAKVMISKECRIGDTCFTSLAIIGGNLYKRHPKNLNHVYKDSKDLLSVIIILVTYVNGGETVFMM